MARGVVKRRRGKGVKVGKVSPPEEYASRMMGVGKLKSAWVAKEGYYDVAPVMPRAKPKRMKKSIRKRKMVPGVKKVRV